MEQLCLFDEPKTAYVLFNGEYGEHTYGEMRISRTQFSSMRDQQKEAYAKQDGKTYGDFEVLGIEYDWGEHKQKWRVRCVLCGREEIKDDGYYWSRGKGMSRKCQCNKERKLAELKRIQEERTLENERIESEKEDKIREEIGRVYGKYEVIEYKGNDNCKVRCVECGAERRKGVKISNLKIGIYPKCDCGKPKYSDPKWVGTRMGHLVVEEYGAGYFLCRCDCGRERTVSATYFARGRYRDCGELTCEYISEMKRQAMNARVRGNTYEALARGIIESGGYKAKIIGKVGDFGVDIVAESADGERIAVQCKSNMKSLTGVSAVQQVYAGGRYYGLTKFAVISHSGYSVNAVKMAKKLGVYLSDGKEFAYPDNMEVYSRGLVPTYNFRKNEKAQKLYELDGRKQTLANWAFEYGTEIRYIKMGLDRGLTLRNALEYKPKKAGTVYTVRGFSGTFAEIYEHFRPAITMQGIRERMKSGMGLEEAFFLPRQQTGRPRKGKEELGQVIMDI